MEFSSVAANKVRRSSAAIVVFGAAIIVLTIFIVLSDLKDGLITRTPRAMPVEVVADIRTDPALFYREIWKTALLGTILGGGLVCFGLAIPRLNGKNGYDLPPGL